MPKIDTELNVHDLQGPIPILRVRATLKKMRPGSVLKIIGVDSDAARDIESFCGQTENQLLPSPEERRPRTMLIRKSYA